MTLRCREQAEVPPHSILGLLIGALPFTPKQVRATSRANTVLS